MIKSYSRRDSATTALRKIGVKKEDYNKFITLDGDIYLVDLDEAKQSLVKPLKTIKTSLPTDVLKNTKDTVSSRARELILEGLDNKVVFERLKDQFGLDDSKKHYPAWYRRELRLKGLID